jgi:hypothetical protein
MNEKASDDDTGTHAASRNALVANQFTISRAVWNMHDALLTEQRRTNQLLETLIEMQGGSVPTPKVPPPRRSIWEEGGLRFDDLGQVIETPLEPPKGPPKEGGPMFDDNGQVIG